MRTPERPFFVWDGECNFCGRWAGWLERSVRPRVPLIAAQDLDDLSGAGLIPDDIARASWWIPADGPPRPGADGIATALRAGQPIWARFIGVVIALPLMRSVARVAYRLIAANRHRLPAPDRPSPKRYPVDR